MKNYALLYKLNFLICLVLFLGSCETNVKEPLGPAVADYYKEKHRPQFHFTPEANWMNDPNGMVYLNDEYHLFYQYYPDSNVWGPMHWGHAISKDLNYWEHLPIGLFPDSLGWIFSGSAVYDKDNTSGFGKNGKGPLVAIFSHHNPIIEKTGSDKFQYQSIAYSNDSGRTWTKYEGNPVVNNPGIRDFRDPKVIWHEKTKLWIMTVTALDHVKFYSSPDLKDWTYLSDFGRNVGSHDGVWECPDMFPIKSASGKNYWVLLQNMNPGNPNGGSGLQYFIGQFDGKEFTIDPAFNKLLAPIPAHIPNGDLFQDFENGHGDWKATGNAFVAQNAQSINSISIQHKEGKGFVNSFNGDNAKTGELASPEFSINSDYINFKIAGGNHRGRTLMALEVNGKRVREVEGRNSNKLEWKGWNVAAYKGQSAQLKIIDNHTASWGYIVVDNIMFSDEQAHEEISGSVWLDAGRDNYAGITWDNAPDNEYERTFIGWMSNWAYAQVVPTNKWRSAMTLPWKLMLREINGIPRLIGSPVVNRSLYTDSQQITINGPTDLPESKLAHLSLKASTNKDFSLKLNNSKNEEVVLAYNSIDKQLTFDRRQSGDMSFSREFPSISKVTRIKRSDEMELEIFVDHSSIEIFIDNGANIFTELFFPSELYSKVILSGDIEGRIQELRSIW